MLDEIELKAVVPDLAACLARVAGAGARRTFAGRLLDRRWDHPARTLADRDEVVRVRTSVPADGAPATTVLDWKGPSRVRDGYKVRAERSTPVGDVAVLEHVLAAAGLVVTREIDREIDQFDLGGAMLRFERYPRMDDLLEVEGTPETIERAIAATGLPRVAFTTARLAEMAADFERRTGRRAALCARELDGDYRYRDADA